MPLKVRSLIAEDYANHYKIRTVQRAIEKSEERKTALYAKIVE